MIRYDRRTQILASCLSGLAGFVDALGFLTLSGFFVSFMSGNSTRLALGLVERSQVAIVSAGIIVVFVVGVFAGSLIGRSVGQRRRAKLIFFVAGLLAIAALSNAIGQSGAAMAFAILAMGAENAVFEQDGEVHIGLTYMTGALVKAGQRMAAACLEGDRFGWIPYACLWASLIVGAVLGSLAHNLIGLSALWGSAVYAALLGLAAMRLEKESGLARSAS